MIPFAKKSLKVALDFEETTQRIAHKLGLDVENLKQRAADYATVRGLDPVEALHRLAAPMFLAALAEEET